jgi:hypothetical protein
MTQYPSITLLSPSSPSFRLEHAALSALPGSFFFFFFFRDRVSLCSSGCPGTHFVDQTGLELGNLPASASQVLGLKACATMPGHCCLLMQPRNQCVLHEITFARAVLEPFSRPGVTCTLLIISYCPYCPWDEVQSPLQSP